MSDKTSVSDMLERIFLLGVGAASLTKDKAQELIDELVKRGQLSQDQGLKLMDEVVDKARSESAGVMESASGAYQDALKAIGVAGRDQVEELERRIAVLESKVYGKPARVVEPERGFTVTPTESEEPT